jgi:cellulose biosynthesis protein BcsQ
MMMFAAGEEEVHSHVDMLLQQDATLSTLDDASVHLARILPRTWLVPASYTFGSVEGKALLGWLMEPDQSVDARYMLARLLLSPEVRKRYSAIILDMPPRLTLGAVNALVASHYLLVPSALDRMSTEALRQFLAIAKGIKGDLKLDVDLLGAVGTLSRNINLNEREKLAWKRIGEHCVAIWQEQREFRFARTIPRKDKIAEAAGEAIAYLSAGTEVRSIFNELGDEIWERIFGVPSAALDTESSPHSEQDEASGKPSESA